MRMRSVGLIVGIALAMTIGSTTRAGEPTAADLIGLVPVIQTTDPALKSLEIVGSMTIKDAGLVRFKAFYRAPDHYSILLSDSTDGTPLVYVADGQLLFYDPIRSSVSYLKDCSEQLRLESDGKLPRFVFEVGRTSKSADAKGGERDLFKLDAKSLFEAKTGTEQRVLDEGNGRYRLFSTRGERTTVASFDTSKSQPIESLKVFEKNGSEPVLSVDKLVVDGPLAKNAFAFPDRKTLSRKIPVHELAGDFLPAGAEKILLAKSIQTRFAIKHPGVLEDLKPPDFAKQSWKVLQKRDKAASAVLRDFVPVDRRSTMAPGPKPPANPPVTPVAGLGGPTLR
jgi:hypothetical protein